MSNGHNQGNDTRNDSNQAERINAILADRKRAERNGQNPDGKPNRSPVNLESINIFEMIKLLGDVHRDERVPGAKQLRAHGGTPVISMHGCTVYPNGYVLYEREDCNTVMWLPDCSEYTCWFVRPRSEEVGLTPDKMVYDMSEFSWVHAIMIHGDARIDHQRTLRRGYWALKMPNRQGKRKGQTVTESDEGSGAEAGNARFLTARVRGPEDCLITRETIHDALKILNDRDRIIFMKYHYYGYTMREIGEEMGISIQRVSVCLNRLQKSLQAKFRPYL